MGISSMRRLVQKEVIARRIRFWLWVLWLIQLQLIGCSNSSDDGTLLPSPIITERITDRAPGVEGRLAYDSIRDRLIFVSGRPFQTWEWTGDRWLRRFTDHEPAATDLYDVCGFPPKGGVVMVSTADTGDGAIIPSPETWLYDGEEWNQLVTDNPLVLAGGGLAYDPKRQRLLTTGGITPGLPLLHRDFSVWAFDGRDWSRLPENLTVAGEYASLSLAFDQGRDRLVLCGFRDQPPIQSPLTTWEYDGDGWALVNDSEGISGPMIYDERAGVILGFIGWHGLSATDFTIVAPYIQGSWDLNYFLLKGFAAVGSAAFHQGKNKIFAFRHSETLSFTPPRGWALERPQELFTNFSHGKAVYFKAKASIAFIFRRDFFDDRIETWLWDGISPSLLTYFIRMPLNDEFEAGALAADPIRDRLLLFMLTYDSERQERYLETYQNSVPNWKYIAVAAGKPIGLNHLTACAHPLRGSVIVVGSVTEQNSSGQETMSPLQTWEFAGDSWSRITTEHSPPGRANSSLVYDEQDNLLVLFGGKSSYCFNDTWEFDGQDWRQVDLPRAPEFRESAAMVYFTSIGGSILIGGRCGSDTYHDIWEYRHHQWTRLTSEKEIIARFGAATAFDPLRQIMAIIGGMSDSETHGSLHELRLE
jgi:hypothetical protein